MRGLLVWAVVIAAIGVPIAAAATSPLLQWRGPVYIGAGFAGIFAMALMFLQPLLASDILPGLAVRRGRDVHHWIGGAIVLAVLLHVAGLWITSPPDVVDALTFTSPTPFSAWGVIAMWALFATALLASQRRRLRLRWRTWRIAHTGFALVIVAGTIAHAMLIDGAMELFSKIGLSVLLALSTLIAIAKLQVWARRPASKR